MKDALAMADLSTKLDLKPGPPPEAKSTFLPEFPIVQQPILKPKGTVSFEASSVCTDGSQHAFQSTDAGFDNCVATPAKRGQSSKN